MRILPVLDLLGGQVVRGVGGRRDEYRPVVSRLTPSAQPRAVARALRDHFGLTHFYVADLDAIRGEPPAFATYRELHDEGLRLWVDAGVRTVADAAPLIGAGVAGVVAGLETLTGPDALRQLGECYGPERLVFSLDLKEGKPLTTHAGWGDDPLAIAGHAVDCGIRQVIVLDLAMVGTGNGTGTEALCAELARRHPELVLVAGGGVRGAEDLYRLQSSGVRAALVASALHDGRLGREELAALRGHDRDWPVLS